MDTNKIIKNIIGTKNKKDSDNDGVVNSKDCQPYNTMRQDAIAESGIKRLQQGINRTSKL